MVVYISNLQMEVKELKNHSEGINKTLWDERKQLKNQIEDMVVNNTNLQMELKELKNHFEGINKTLWDERKQLKNQIEDMVVNNTNLQMELKELKNHFEDMVVNNTNLQMELKEQKNHSEGINKTLWDEIKQLKNQIEVLEGERCPEGWKRFGCSCYYKSTEKRNWTDSRSFCEDKGSDLVVVNSKEEQQHFKETL
ncbi:asialoglycoprotein receptor 1-like [Oryzias latipes]|uniref:asialoglycoprotein receptor 1-like n=1 Tax=Oryzias latipes TaxID=8090 RepID=UPI000CE25F9B|nr:asialoglycoprotein receptor 1-like [Oryzias latipes]